MKLTWKDLATVPFMVAIIAVFVTHVIGAEGWWLGSTRGTATTILILGIGGGCALSGAGDVFTRAEKSGPGIRLYAIITALLGLAALVGGVVALAAGNESALTVLFASTMALWVLATARHLVTEPRPSAADTEAREILDRIHAHHR
ncbi:MAG TPA: hypothetical protein VL551_32130 [Actinospica sp.]|jgi:hypothetical protein|nr:hypothetical protein [Actinospica sp.]